MEFMVSSALPAPWLLYAGAVLDFGFAAVSVGCLSENHEDMLLRNPFDSSFSARQSKLWGEFSRSLPEVRA